MNPAELILTPTRERLFRACKSPCHSKTESQQKNNTEEQNLKEAERNKYKHSRKNQDFASDLIQNFPFIQSHFEILKTVGEGTFSVVYLARLREDKSQMYAIKYLVPTSSPGRIENELLCLQLLGGKNNVLPVKTVMRNRDHVIFILPYFPHQRFSDFVKHMTVRDIQEYMWNLLIALKHVHKKNIIHRDVKPSNFLYSKELKRYTLIDFGLAMSVPGCKTTLLKDYTVVSSTPLTAEKSVKESGIQKLGKVCKHPTSYICIVCRQRPRQCAPRAGTSGFRSPEVLARYAKQTTAVDMWSAGVIFLCMLSRRYPFFKACDDMEALSQITALVGTQKMTLFAETIGKDFVFGPVLEAVDPYKVLCNKLAQRVCPKHTQLDLNLLQEHPEKKGKRKREEDCESDADISYKKHDISEKTCEQTRTNVSLNNQVLKDDNSPKNAKYTNTSFKDTQTIANICFKNDQTPTKVDFKDQTLIDLIGSENDNQINNDGSHNLIKTSYVPKVSKITEINREVKNQNQENDAESNECLCIPDSAFNLLERLLELDPQKRITAEEALLHPFLSAVKSSSKLDKT
ncbi:cell division cycle 7-related protein kinase isoform X1 [Hydra vulgaris]|uniref:cell division cycle 7-related protein kinase isoform X1 n=1 Tax=Hydra vulgaris TaxID=6087 RepID=UPI001F5F568D|nr:cell division cycle 7-related protein kinase isoform X1 [Hydra vulgaris]